MQQQFVKVIGIKRDGTQSGVAMRAIKDNETLDAIEEKIAALKGQVKVGMSGLWRIEARGSLRVDMAQRGATPPIAGAWTRDAA